MNLILNPNSTLKKILRYIDFYFIDIILTLTAIIIFLFFPKKLLSFYRIEIKPKSNLNGKNILSHWQTKSPSKRKKEINILLRGSSLRKNLKNINKALPTFAVNIIKKPKNSKDFMGLLLVKMTGV